MTKDEAIDTIRAVMARHGLQCRDLADDLAGCVARAPQAGWEQDAKRYRWIRDTCNGCPADAEFWPAIALYELKGQSDDDFTSHQNLDAAIDAAIAAAPSPITGDSNE